MTPFYQLAFFSVIMTVIFSYTEGISVSSCSRNPSNDAFRIIDVDVNPDPVRVPGENSVGGTVEVLRDIEGQIDVELQVKKKLFFFQVPLPCIQGIGSCSYRDMCTLLTTPYQLCTDYLTPLGFPCTCPIEAKRYTFPSHSFTVGSLGRIGNYLASGRYEVKARFIRRDTGEDLACLKVDVRLD